MNALLITCICLFSLIHSIRTFDSKLDGLWKLYQVKYEKKYTLYDEKFRRSIWEENAKSIALHNLEADAGIQSYRMELNKFSDMNKDERKAYRDCLKITYLRNRTERPELYQPVCAKDCERTLPKFVDWRKKGFVTKVKDQGDCGSCWAFSSTGSLEGQVKAKTGQLVSLSEQNLVDCSSKEGNDGCDGGYVESAFQYVMDNEGLDTEDAYPYKAYEGQCSFKRRSVGANCTTYKKVKSFSEIDLQAAVATIGPISVAIDAEDKFMNYKQGIFQDDSCSRTDLDHAVLVVGYGSQGLKDYWIVKNSWGTDWGMDGYILMSRNRHNQCGIATDAVYPII